MEFSGSGGAMLPHEKLHVYHKALAFASVAFDISAPWDRKYAVADHLSRAAESVLLNLVDAARLRAGSGRMRALDYSIGSTLECAACMDVARIRELLSMRQQHEVKCPLCELTRMLIGLRKGWEKGNLREATAPYGNFGSGIRHQPLFHHESLVVYRAALDLNASLLRQSTGHQLPTRLWRQLDEGLTSLVLNIAEGNGRYSELDHRRFLDIAEGAAAKVAVLLDLGIQRKLLRKAECQSAKGLLRRIVAMLSRM